jgi:hypothetical protein
MCDMIPIYLVTVLTGKYPYNSQILSYGLLIFAICDYESWNAIPNSLFEHATSNTKLIIQWQVWRSHMSLW